eukprot:TRINITY_DN2010_c0_g2_i2.p1 TRINITY_DN2010_c0_g2~~TRINITY_DN2010_c0_g2_i2.p1  ORF type:complete len:165 (+),score=40.73 TRINITY_DN2010_c0_g2_i2:1-495(+)
MMPEQDPSVVPYTLEAIQRADIENGHPGQTTLIPVGGTQSSIAALLKPLPGLAPEAKDKYTLGSMGDSQPYLQGYAAALSAALYDSTLRGEVLLRDVASSRTLRAEDAQNMKRRVECEVWGADTFKSQNYAPDPVDYKLNGFVFFPVCNYTRCGGETEPCSGPG